MVLEYRVSWDYGEGAPGLSVFHGRGGGGTPVGIAAQAMADDIRAFFDAIKGSFHTTFTWTFSGEVLDLNTSTGVLEAVHAVTPPATVTGTGATVYAAPAGATIRWFTPAIVEGRRLQGKTFLVPLTSGAYSTDGSLSPSVIGTLGTAADALMDEGVGGEWNFSVWSRTHGVQADVTSKQVPDRVSILRSRRD